MPLRRWACRGTYRRRDEEERGCCKEKEASAAAKWTLRVGPCGCWQKKGKEILAYDYSSDSLKQIFFLKQIPRTGDLSKREEKQWGSGFAVGQWLSPQGA